jgi:sigma-B regulation protein RsbU (phosphoserine phosphatase)
MPVGLLPNAEFDSGSFQLDAGSCVLLVSDGFTEAADPSGEFFGDHGLDKAACCSDLTGILDLLEDFCMGTPADDDRTLVRLHFLP